MGKLTFPNLILDQWTPVPPVLTADLTGKSVLVVGSNTGIGLETAIHFARMNPARLIVTCRNEQKGWDTVSRELTRYVTTKIKIEHSTLGIAKVTSYRAEAQVADLGDFESIQNFAKRLEGDPLDIIVANAAIAQSEFKKTKDGWEETSVFYFKHLRQLPQLTILLVYKSTIYRPRCFQFC